jgi:HK97 gp10 family phage protein
VATFDISQLELAIVDLKSAPREVRDKAKQVLKKSAFDVERNAKAIVPVDTGNLKNSIGHSDMRNISRDNLAVEVGPTANYGRFVELGTSRMPPQAFMGPSLDRVAPAFSDAMAQLGAEVFRGR